MRRVILFGLLMGAVMVACESKTPVGPSTVTITEATTTASACTFTLSPASGSVAAAGGTGTVTVVTQTGCKWTVENFANWVTVEPTTERTGSGQIVYTAAATTTTRETTIVVAGLPFLLRQDLAAQVPTTTTIGATTVTRRYIGTSPNPALPNDMTLALNLVTASGVFDSVLEGLPLIGKQATYSVTGVYRTGGGGGGTVRGSLDGTIDNGNFSGSMTFEAAGCSAGREYFGQLSASSLTWTGGRIIQDCKDSPFGFSTLTMVTAGTLPPTTTVPTTTMPGCNYGLNPGGGSIGLSGGSGSVQVVTQPGCGWSAQSVVSWVTVQPSSGSSGPGAVQYTVAAGGPRETTLIIAGLPFVLRQEASPTTTTSQTCTYTLSPPSSTVPAAGGAGSVTVVTQTGCQWSVQNFANWITVNPTSGTGSGAVNYTAAATTAAREATIVIQGSPFLLRQDAPVLSPDVVPFTPLGGGDDYCRISGTTFFVGVRNLGPGAAGASVTRVSFVPNDGTPSSNSLPTASLPSGGTVDVAFPYPRDCEFGGGCTIQIVVDANNELAEGTAGEGNNTVDTQCSIGTATRRRGE